MAIAAIPQTAIAQALAPSEFTPVAAQNPQPLTVTEYVAATQPGLQSGVSPGQLGQEMITNLMGFFDRSTSMRHRARMLSDTAPPSQTLMTVAHRGPAQQALDPGTLQVGPQPTKGDVNSQQMERVIESLGLMFDYSIETQLVVRGATQISGAANTLLRGQ
jgi:hypothetical protein